MVDNSKISLYINGNELNITGNAMTRESNPWKLSESSRLVQGGSGKKMKHLPMSSRLKSVGFSRLERVTHVKESGIVRCLEWLS